MRLQNATRCRSSADNVAPSRVQSAYITPRFLPSAWIGIATAAEMPSLRTLWNVRATGSDAATGTCTTRPFSRTCSTSDRLTPERPPILGPGHEERMVGVVDVEPHVHAVRAGGAEDRGHRRLHHLFLALQPFEMVAISMKVRYHAPTGEPGAAPSLPGSSSWIAAAPGLER